MNHGEAKNFMGKGVDFNTNVYFTDTFTLTLMLEKLKTIGDI